MAEHSIHLINRKNVEMGGVNKVISFDEDEILFETNMGCLAIHGEDLHIVQLNLDNGEVEVEGSVNSLEYKPQGTDFKVKGKNVLNRLFK